MLAMRRTSSWAYSQVRRLAILGMGTTVRLSWFSFYAVMDPDLRELPTYAPSAGPDSDALAEDGSAPIDKSEVNFGSNYKRLQEIKKKYDPDVVFNKWFVIKPSA